MTGLFAVLVVALAGLVIALLTAHWPVALFFAGLTLGSATFLVSLIAERRRS